MPRKPLTPAQRADSVSRASDALTSAVDHAITARIKYGDRDARTLAAWEAVESHGAIVHRQSRLLAGKSKGG